MFVINHSRPQSAYASDSSPSCAKELWGNKQTQCACWYPRKHISKIYSLGSTRHNPDVWIAAVPESCSTADLVELFLIVLPNQIKELWFRCRASAVLMSNLIQELSSARQKHDVWTEPYTESANFNLSGTLWHVILWLSRTFLHFTCSLTSYDRRVLLRTSPNKDFLFFI